MSEAAPARLPDGPVVQSIAIGFRVLYVATLLLALGWFATNLREVPADSQAVVLRFGRVVGVRPAGLIVAWPRPVEQVTLLPSPDRQIALAIPRVAPGPGLEDAYTHAMGADQGATAGAFLTGDGGVVLLDATLYFQVSDAAAYYLAEPHVAPALRRLFLASAITVASGHALDDFLVSRSDRAGADAAGLEAARLGLRGDLLAGINRRLADLAASGAPLGVTVARVDLQASLPPQAKIAYDSVLEAAQQADQSIASARTDSTRAAQEGDRERDRVLTAAHATAAEQVSDARARTATIEALQARMTPEARPGLLDQVYREQIAAIMAKTGHVTAVDARGGSRLILPGAKP